MRGLALLFLSLVLSVSCPAQGGPEFDALIDAIFAKDLKALSQHLPPELNDAIAKASPAAQQRFAQVFLVAKMLEREGGKVMRPESGAVLRIERKNPGVEGEASSLEIYLDKSMTDGNETMLRFRVNPPKDEEFRRDTVATVWMRYVDGEWRVYELEGDGDDIHLDSPKFLERFTGAQGDAQEASAVGSMRTLNTANITYASTYPDIGFPSSIAVLGGTGGSPDGAGLIDSVLASGVKSGYRFTYTVSSDHMAYTITARPVEGGGRSFFTDQSGVIRYTTEDREPTEEDEPLQ